MFSIEVREDNLDDLLSELKGLRDFRPDLSGLRQPITQTIQEEHRRARLAGLDRFGKPLAPLAPSTLKTRDGNGPPLAPHEAGSRVVNNFVVNVEPTSNGVRIEAGYVGMPWIRYHAQGAGRLPVRDVIGLQPEAELRVERLVLNEIDNQVLTAMRRRPQGFFGKVRSFFGRK